MKRIRYVLQSHIVWALMAAHVVFLIGLRVTDRILFQEVLNGIAFGVAVGAMVATGPEALRSMFMRPQPARFGGDLLIVAIPLGWLATAIGSAWSLYWRALGQPPGMLDEAIWAYHRFLYITAGGLCMLSPVVFRGRLPPIELLKVAGWVALGGFVCAMVLLVVSRLYY